MNFSTYTSSAGAFTYELVKSGPSVLPDEVEERSKFALELSVNWEGNVLHVAHLFPFRSFFLGEPEIHLKRQVDFVMPAEVLGTPLLELVHVLDGVPLLTLPGHSLGVVDTATHGRVGLDALPVFGGTSPHGTVSGSLRLEPGMRVTLWLGRFEIHIELVARGRTLARKLLDSDAVTLAQTTGLTLLSVAGLLASMAFFVPPLGLTDEQELDKSRLVLAQQYLKAFAEREKKEIESAHTEDAPNPSGGSGERHRGEPGSMGTQQSRPVPARYRIQGPKDNPNPHLAKQATLQEVRDFGMIGILSPGKLGALGPVSPFGQDTALGFDESSNSGSMWGDGLSDAYGAAGLDVSGTGSGSGGDGVAVGMGPIGTLGHGDGRGDGDEFGNGHGRLKPDGHGPRVPKVRTGPTSVSGRLPGEVIQRIVRQNFGRFRMCYEAGLHKNPNLEGRITVRFAIDRTGSVATSQLGASDLPDSQVTSCVVAAFYGLGFPKPEGGLVSVTYPIMFSPQ